MTKSPDIDKRSSGLPPEEYENWLEIVRHNKGFSNPHDWVEYAAIKNFQKIDAVKLECCPSCGESKNRKIGQYVYYSQLISLRKCRGCGLFFSDVRINTETTIGHFEHAYKDRDYFFEERKLIFEHIIDTVSGYLTPGTTLLDVGGSTGYFARLVREKYPHTSITVSDISKEACLQSENLGFETICLSMEDLNITDKRYDLVTVLDTLYYADNINNAIDSLAKVTAPGGHLIIRLPNRTIPLLINSIKEKLGLCKYDDKILYFNPEHNYYLSWSFMRKALSKMGYNEIRRYRSLTNYIYLNKVSKPDRFIHKIRNLIFSVSRYINFPPTATLIIATRQNRDD